MPLTVEGLLSGALDLLHPLHGVEGVPHEVAIVLDRPVPPLLELERRILRRPSACVTRDNNKKQISIYCAVL